MVQDGTDDASGGSSYKVGVQELVGDAQTILRAFVLLIESIGGTIEYPFEKLTDPAELTDRVIYAEYDEAHQMVRYTVKHHEVITGELIAPQNRDSE